MNGSIGAALIGWGILIAFLVIKHFVRKKDYSDVSHQQNVIDEIVKKRKESEKTKILYFKSNKAAFEFALMSLMNGFGTMNFNHLGVIKGKPFGKKKEVQEKIKGDVEIVTNEISKYKIKVAYQGKEIEVVATRTDNLSAEKKPTYKVGDLIIVTDLSQSLRDKMQGKPRNKNLDYNFMTLAKVTPAFNVKKMDFIR